MFKSLECPVCYQIYNDSNKAPCTLYCGHTIDIFCFKTMINNDNNSLKCPTCRKIRFYPEDPAVNFKIIEVVKLAFRM